MKYTILGFSQEKLIELGLDYLDAVILRYFIDFRNTKKMTSKIIDGECYYWVDYQAIINEYPILNLKTKDSIYRRLKKLEEARVLKHVTVRKNGTYSFYNIDDNYIDLISKNDSEIENFKTDKNPNHTDISPKGTDINPSSTDEKSQAYGCKVGTNNPSTKSININNVEKNLDDEVVKKTIDYLNLKTNKQFKHNTKATTRLIHARIQEGFKLNDFIKVIDNMTLEWKGTLWEKYLVPTTLFAGKFERYLNLSNPVLDGTRINHKPINKPANVKWGEM